MHLPSRRRNALLMAALAIATFTAAPARAGDDDLSDIGREVAKRHDEAVARLQDWIARRRSPPRTSTSRTAPSTWRSWRATPASSRPR